MMILKIQKDVISKALTIASKGLPTKTPLEALYQIKFEATEAGLRLTSSNVDLTIKHFIPAATNQLEIKAPGTALLPGKQLVELVKRFKEGWVTFSFVEGAVVVKSGNSRFTLKSGELSQYPILFEDLSEPTQSIEVSGNQLMKLFKETLPFTATNESRPALTGVHFTIDADHWQCVSTDSFRLSQVEVAHHQAVEGKTSVIIPHDSLADLIKLFPTTKEDQRIKLSLHPTELIFETDDLVVYTRLIGDAFPDTSAFVPATFNQTVQVDRLELLELIDRLLLISDLNSTVFLTLKSSQGTLNLYTSQECGKAEEEMDAQGIQSDLRICFNGKFLKEAIQSLSGATLELCFNGDLRPFVLHELNQSQSIRLIVPMRAA